MAVAVFDYPTWALRFPTLATKVSAALAALYFGEATDLLDNTDASLIVDPVQRLRFLNLLVAHIAALNGASPMYAAGMVGRISSVTEGSISISSDYTTLVGSAAWYAQTPWGAEYWALTVGYRSATYVPGDQPYQGVPGNGGLGVNGGWGDLRWLP